MVSRNTRVKILFIVLAILVLFMPFIYPTCRIEEKQLHIGVASPLWVIGPEGGILTVKITIKNSGGCDANIESLQFRMYRLIYTNNTEDVDLNDMLVIHTTIPPGGNVTVNFGFEQPFRGLGPRAVLVKITVVLQEGSSLEVFDGLIDTTGEEQTS